MIRVLAPMAVVVLGFAGYAVAQSSSAKPATLCAKKTGGVLRLARDGKCKRSETKLRVNQVVTVRGPAGAPGRPGADGAAGRDATPADFAGEPAKLVAGAPGVGGQCAAVAQFCTGGNGWLWRNYGNGYDAVGFWKDRGGVVHLQGVAELTGGAGGGQSAAFILPDGYRPPAARRFTIVSTADTPRHVDVHADGRVEPVLGGAGTAPLDGISFRP
ncbi:MAG: hypothetical protein QOJ85_4018 [Solirubrobacteraceae bacterium]|nr:hypothetical protein [Solirubrobacteraceae bacterium]